MIVRRVKKIEKFTTIDNAYLNDVRLSFKAKGILTYLLSLPDDWVIHIDQLVGKSKDGVASFRSGLDELIKRGYLKRYPIMQDGQITRWETEIFESLDNRCLLSENQEVEVKDIEKRNSLSDKDEILSKASNQSVDKGNDEIGVSENQKLDNLDLEKQEVDKQSLLNTNKKNINNTNDLYRQRAIKEIENLWMKQRGVVKYESLETNPSYCKSLLELINIYGEDPVKKAIKNTNILAKRRKNKVSLPWFLREVNFRRAAFMKIS